MYLKNEDVKIGTIPDANGSDTPLRKMEFLTKKEMKDSSRLYGKVIVPSSKPSNIWSNPEGSLFSAMDQ